MSGKLCSRVLESALPSWIKPYAVALASFGNETGERIFPTGATVAKLTGRSERQAHRALRELRRRGVLQPQRRAHQRAPVEYRLIELKLPTHDDPDQIELFPQAARAKSPMTTRSNPQFAQARTAVSGHPCHIPPDIHVTRSSIDPPPVRTTNQRARKGK